MCAHKPKTQAEVGDVIPGAGGARKVRWALGARGKSGGARVIYYVGSVVIYLLALYTKGSKSNLTQREVALLHRICKALP
ncbi:MAG: hypothetical protein KC492_11170 [Myxococcales bacterium]|nr:hypothetical protein [Myxococcales bacterium]